MLISLMESKIHQARVTEADMEYVGSLSIDEELMEISGLRENQEILIADIDNGERLVTYVIRAPAGSRKIGVNGAAAHQIRVGDRIIIMSFSLYTPEEADVHEPRVIVVDENNDPVQQSPVELQ